MNQLTLDMQPLTLGAVSHATSRTGTDFYEFFAGAGMARAGLGSNWNCLFANDFDHKKSRIYDRYWGPGILKSADIATLTVNDLPGRADLVWGSFPCQDLSLAGAGAGLKGERSGVFWPFWRLMEGLVACGRAPGIIALENVCGALTSHGGTDFTSICCAMRDAGYRFGAVVIDAALFVPQSRPRLFVIAIRNDIKIPAMTVSSHPCARWHNATLLRAYNRLPEQFKENWIWWSLPIPNIRVATLANIIEDNPDGVSWHTAEETKRLLDMMSDINRAKVFASQRYGCRIVGGIYKRTRHDDEGCKVQRAEVRFDNLAGCLRTPAGGSSRQTILIVDGESIKSRLISARETARLMGLPDDYELPKNYNEAYHLTGDGVVVPVVRHLAANIFEPILVGGTALRRAA